MSYRGFTAAIPLGGRGFTGDENTDNLQPSDLILGTNIRFDGDLLRKVGGLTRYDANAVASTPTCLAGIDWWPTVSIQKQVTVWSNGKIYKEVGGDVDSVELGTGFTFSAPVTLLPCGQEIVGNNRKLLIFCKGVEPLILNANGTTVSNITTAGFASADWSAANWPGAGIIHDNRVATWGNANAPHAIYFSAIDDHTNFKATDPANANSFPLPIFDIAPGEAEYINACYSLGNTRLYVFKYPTGIYYIDTDDLTALFAPVTTVRRDIGIAGPKAITKVGDLGTWFIGHDGHVYSLDILNDPNAEPRNACLTRNYRLSKFIKENILPSRLAHSNLIYDTNRGEVWAIYTKTASTTHDIALIFDVNDPSNVRIAVEDRGSYYNAAWIVKESNTFFNLYIAGTGGLIYKTDQTNRVIHTSTGYNGYFRLADTDFRWLDPKLADVDKRLDFIEIRAKNSGNYSILVDLYIDGDYYNTFSVELGASGSLLNTGMLDSFILGGEGYIRRRIKIGGIGRKFSVKLRNEGANEDFGITSFIYYFQTLGSEGEA